MEAKYFHPFVTQSCLLPNEKAEAWRICKEQSPQEALLFVTQIEERMAAHRQTLSLRPFPVPYKVW